MSHIPRKDLQMTYAPGQIHHLIRHLKPEVKWFLLGGPADGDEAQVLHGIHPDLKIIGFEPNPAMAKIQMDRGFPGDLLSVALWSASGYRRLTAGSDSGDLTQVERSSSLVKYSSGRVYHVWADTLDRLSDLFGPFRDAALWIDIEGAEMECLVGAKSLLERGMILLVNVEVFSAEAHPIRDYLDSYGLYEVDRWGHQVVGDRQWWNVIYRRA